MSFVVFSFIFSQSIKIFLVNRQDERKKNCKLCGFTITLMIDTPQITIVKLSEMFYKLILLFSNAGVSILITYLLLEFHIYQTYKAMGGQSELGN